MASDGNSTASQRLVDFTDDDLQGVDAGLSVLRVIALVLSVLNFTLILTLNPLCLIVIQRVANMQPTTKMFMTSLTVSDLGTGIFVLLPHIVDSIAGYWPFGVFACSAFRIAKYLFFCLCFLSLLLLTIDRYIAVVRCLHYPRLVTVRRSRVAVFGVLILVTTVSITGNVFNERRPTQPFSKPACEPTDEKVLIHITLGLAFLALIMIVVMYIHILTIARRQARRIAQERPVSPNVPQGVGTNSFTTIITITVVVVGGWVPLLVGVFLVNNGISLPLDTTKIVYALYFTTNWMDAVAFYVRNTECKGVLHRMATAAVGTVRRKLVCIQG